jgi:hypothetical protein
MAIQPVNTIKWLLGLVSSTNRLSNIITFSYSEHQNRSISDICEQRLSRFEKRFATTHGVGRFSLQNPKELVTAIGIARSYQHGVHGEAALRLCQLEATNLFGHKNDKQVY